MVVVDGKGLPLAASVHSTSPAESQLLEDTIGKIRVPRGGPRRSRSNPEHIIGDKTYDCNPLRERLAQRHIELIAKHRRNRVRSKTQDGRSLRRYRRRWKVERTLAWLQNYRRLVVRYELHRRIS